MHIRYIENLDVCPRAREGVRQLLALCDHEFVPPLSARSSTTQSQLDGANGPAGQENETIDAYFASVCDQRVLAAFDGDEVVGFMSFREDYTCGEIGADMFPNIYVTTVIVNPDHRGRGITYDFYRMLVDRFRDRNIFTRTWSSNAAHIHILAEQGFDEHVRLPDARGKGIDTVYYRRRPAV